MDTYAGCMIIIRERKDDDDVWDVEGDHQLRRPSYRLINNIWQWWGRDLRGATQLTSDRTEWRKFMTSPNDLS